MNQQTADSSTGVWVRLWLESQTEGSLMPAYIDGFLVNETPASYVLSKVMTTEETETYDLVKKEVVEPNFISRTYVWRCQVLGSRPIEENPVYNGVDGLG